MRLLLPGLCLSQDDYAALAATLPGETRILNTLTTPVTSAPEDLRAALAAGPGPHELIGHSIGGLSAVRWAAQWPEEIDNLILLDPSDPWSEPVPRWLGGRGGRLLTGIVGWLSSSRRLAVRLGRRGRRALLGMYGVTEDPLSSDRIDELFCRRTALLAVAEQLTGVPGVVAAVRALDEDAVSAIRVLLIFSAGESDVAQRLADRWRADRKEVDAGHLFPITHPALTAGLIHPPQDEEGRGHHEGI